MSNLFAAVIAKFAASQPRAPKGDPNGGQWVRGEGGFPAGSPSEAEFKAASRDAYASHGGDHYDELVSAADSIKHFPSERQLNWEAQQNGWKPQPAKGIYATMLQRLQAVERGDPKALERDRRLASRYDRRLRAAGVLRPHESYDLEDMRAAVRRRRVEQTTSRAKEKDHGRTGRYANPPGGQTSFVRGPGEPGSYFEMDGREWKLTGAHLTGGNTGTIVYHAQRLKPNGKPGGTYREIGTHAWSDLQRHGTIRVLNRADPEERTWEFKREPGY